MAVYLDLIFLMNLLVNAAMLKLTAWTCRKQMKQWRWWAAAILGAGYVVLLFIPQASFMFSFGTKLLFSVMMVWVAFGYGNLPSFVRVFGFFYFIHFVVAGGLFAFQYASLSAKEWINGWMVTQSGGMGVRPVTGWLLIVGGAFLFWFIRKMLQSHQRQQKLAAGIAEVVIHFGEKSVTCQGLIDTGNRLYDPLSRWPVMVLDVKSWNGILPEAWVSLLSSTSLDEFLEQTAEDDSVWRNRLRIVPFRGIENGQGLMIALKPDKVVIYHQSVTYTEQKVLIGIKKEALSSDGSYQAIIHPDLVSVAG